MKSILTCYTYLRLVVLAVNEEDVIQITRKNKEECIILATLLNNYTTITSYTPMVTNFQKDSKSLNHKGSNAHRN